MFYRIQVSENTKNTLFVPASFASLFVPPTPVTLKVQAGLRKVKVKVVYTQGLEKGICLLSKNIIDKLSIPIDILYQLRLFEDRLEIGPVIGLILCKKREHLTQQVLDILLFYALMYRHHHGLFYVCCLEDVNLHERSAEGYYYIPGDEAGQGEWRKAILPLAAVLYRRTTPGRRTRAKLKKLTHNRFFNSKNLDKWDFWSMASEDPVLRKHIPYTQMLSSGEDVEKMLSRYHEIFIKPMMKSLGRGLIKIARKENGYTLHSHEESKPRSLSDIAQLKKLVDELTGDGSYLVQQGISLPQYHNRISDFRVIMQKDDSMMWQCVSIVACFGKRNGMCSNYKGAGYMLPFDHGFPRMLPSAKEKAQQVRQEIIELCIRACERLDLTGEHYGDIGMDVAIDLDHHLWIIEMNSRQQDHSVPWKINEIENFYKVKTNPIRYAAAISGFTFYPEPQSSFGK